MAPSCGGRSTPTWPSIACSPRPPATRSSRLFPILLQSLRDQLHVFRRRSIEGRGVRSGIEEHATVPEAVRSRDPREAMIRHMEPAERSFQKARPVEH